MIIPHDGFSGWDDHWNTSRVALDGTHHLTSAGQPMYETRFAEVLKFHPPGFAPVCDDSGAYHITPDGRQAYQTRYQRTFGFYGGRAAVHSSNGWFHILPNGAPLYQKCYLWCGNFQEALCAVRDRGNRYFHIADDGTPAYQERYRYAGDFKDGFAVVQRDDGKHSHVDPQGRLLHSTWFLDLDVFHKNHARARDSKGWHHIDKSGAALYQARFDNVEPFYNGQARVRGLDGSLSVIDEYGRTVLELSKPLKSPLEELSADIVGMWRTQTIRAAVELGVFELLPASAAGVEERLQLADSVGARLMRALDELGLVSLIEDGTYHATGRGAYLKRSHPLSLSDAATLWGRETYDAWAGAPETLRTGRPAFTALHNANFFDWVGRRPAELRGYHTALAHYAKHDYQSLAESVDLTARRSILDAGGGMGDLIFALLRFYPNLTGTVMERPEVVALASVPDDLADRCQFVSEDLFQRWTTASDTVILARVLHDWPDDDALRILNRARDAMPEGGILYVVEMLLDTASGAGGLLDLHMLIVTGGGERTLEQFSYLLSKARFEVVDVVETGHVSSVIEARAV